MRLSNILLQFGRILIAFLGVLGILIYSNEAIGQSQTFNTSGTFTVPHKVTTITVQVWGGGGGGGFNSNNGGNRPGGGGGGGGFSQLTNLGVSPTNTFTVTIGNGGAGATTNAAVNGQPSSFVGSAPSPIVNAIGNGGFGGVNLAAGNGGTSSGGNVNRSGGIGGAGINSNNAGGGGGGAAGNNFANGAIGGASTTTTGGAGGAGVSGGGSGGLGGSNGNQSGNPGIAPGGGGGGKSGTGTAGGNGGNGQVIVSWTCSNTLVAGPQPACINLPITPIEYDIAGATGATFSGLPAGVTGIYSAGDVTISGTPTVSGSFTYTITPTGSCTGSTATGTLVVSPNRTAGTISLNSFCIGSPLPLGVNQTTSGATGIGVPTNLPAGITASWASNTITFSGTPTVAGTYSYIIPLIGGCGLVNATGTITINPTSTVSPASSNPTLCIDTPILTNITFSTTGASGIGTATNLPAGVTASWAADIITISGTPTQSGTFNYSIPLVGCGGITATGTITVTPKNTASAASSSPLVCINPAVPISITHSTTGATGIGTATNLPAGVTATWNTDVITISGTPTVSGIFNYSIPLTGGCTVGALPATGTITVNAQAAILSPSLAAQTPKCIGQAFAPISVGTGQGFTYQWYQNTANNNTSGTAISLNGTSSSYLPLSNTAGTFYYYVEVTSPTCGPIAVKSLPSGAFVVNPLPVVSFVSQPAVGNYCVDTDITYSTQTGQSNYVWTIPGALGSDYTITSGGNGSSTLVVRWLTPGSKTVSVNYTDAQSCGATTPATSNPINIQKNTVSPPSNPNPSACSTGVFPTITHATTLATGIGSPTGLPLGLSAVWTGSAASGTITISGTVDPSVTPGPKTYSIPLTGGCGTVIATGVIDIQPVYTINTIASVSPSNTGGTATITLTVSPATLTNGSYVVNYQMGLANPQSASNLTVSFTNGVGTFFTSAINNEDLTSLTINSIRKATDPISCPVPITANNITFFGIQPRIFDSNGTFFVPAGIFQITVKVYGGGGGGGRGSNGAGGGGGGYSEQTINVVPGEAIGIFVGAGGTSQTVAGTPAGPGGTSWATRDSSPPNLPTTGFAFAYGGSGANAGTPGSGGIGQTSNGNIGNNPTGTTGGQGGKGGGVDGGVGGAGGTNGNAADNRGKQGIPFGGGGGGSINNRDGGSGASGYVIITYPLPPVSSCFKVIDDGAISGTTIIEFTCNNMTWTAPEGLLEFRTFVGGGGGGGGAGRGSGGGGAGGLVSGTVTSGSPLGFPANTTFTINAGAGGAGATNSSIRGTNGNPSNLSGTVNGSTVTISAGGGGGGGSENLITPGNGINGGSGGGGGANNAGEGAGGTGSGSGDAGGAGDFSTNQAFAGGGGGGINEIGGEGKGAGLGQGEGGKGGNGLAIIFGLVPTDTTRYFGAGGGGVGFNFNGVIKVGFGGTINGVKIGGDGSITNGIPGVDKTGSGGGSGRNVGAKGGNGVVYIYYDVFRILPIEYLYFNATYNTNKRSGTLTWATSKEWENSHFEIERSINGVSSWSQIGEKQGQGYSEIPSEYTFIDNNIPASGGIAYYRLKQVDFDGKFSYSVTKSIKVEGIKGNGTWIAYPNPSSKKTTISVDLLNNADYTDEKIFVQISDIRGVAETFTVNQIELVSEVVNRYLNRSNQGIYILQLIWGNNAQQLKLFRE